MSQVFAAELSIQPHLKDLISATKYLVAKYSLRSAGTGSPTIHLAPLRAHAWSNYGAVLSSVHWNPHCSVVLLSVHWNPPL